MELADPMLIVSVLRTLSPARSPRLRTKPSGTVYQSPRSSRRCQCGGCRRCRENARWERIFQEKFADPNYYTRRLVRHESPLNEF